jgi:TetR/AcrR family transcriptional regulator, transcriptional repressor for nem operon
MITLTIKTKFLNAALNAVGYEAMTVDGLCRAARVTKGAFFHYFKSKEELAVSAAAHWNEMTGELFASAPYHAYEDPLDQLIAYIDFRAGLHPAPAPLHRTAVSSCKGGLTRCQRKFS